MTSPLLVARRYGPRVAGFCDSPCSDLGRQATHPDPALRPARGRARRPRPDGQPPRRAGPPAVHLPGRQPRTADRPRRSWSRRCGRGARPAGADASLSALLSRLRGRARRPDARRAAARSGSRCPADAWVDLEAAEEAIHRAEPAVAQEDWARGWGPSLVALFTARRGFLPGEDAPWADEHRRRLEDIRLPRPRVLRGRGAGSRRHRAARRASASPASSSPRRRSASMRTRC